MQRNRLMRTFFGFRNGTPLLAGLLLWLSMPFLTHAQDYQSMIDQHLSSYVETSTLQAADVQNWVITDQYRTQHNEVYHVYIQQTHQGIPIYNGVANFAIKDGKIWHMADRLQADLAQRANVTIPSLDPAQAIVAAAAELGLVAPTGLEQLKERSTHSFLFNTGNISRVDIPVKLMYLPGPEGELSLVWDLSIDPIGGEDWWSVRIDAQTGALLDRTNWVVKCSFDHHPTTPHQHHKTSMFGGLQQASSPNAAQSTAQYRVFRLDVESPNHGPRTLEVCPEDSVASPFGWHDTDGIKGAEFTITRGNNVYASEDRDDDNVPGYSPDGGTALNFDFPLNQNQAAANYEDAAITNLFYLNNIMHDLTYHYGFDEAAGNFQENNYGRGGLGSDYVNADAQDGGGTNNANFGTPGDGSNPRMQMFLWVTTGGSSDLLFVNAPSVIAGPYSSTGATFGPGVSTTPVTADLVEVDDATNPDPNDGCETLVNASALSGKIAFINRGNCTFVSKVQAAQNAGAVGAIIVNNVGGANIQMGGQSATITIPSVMISQADGALIRARLDSGIVVNASLVDSSGSQNFPIDGDFDNGIIAHEYGHGVSNRLTGGPSNVGCLNNAEQMGEGWSDYFSLYLSLDTSVITRGIGTFAIDEPITGGGIRPTAYSTDFSINSATYASTNNTGSISQPHGIGYVWCTMLWDLTFKLIETYGYDPDPYFGTGGNNIALQLIMDGMKLQACDPGFVDGRDAILLADQLNYGGANECLIWEVFARRGLGFSADQGSSASRTDQVEAFDLPATCLVATAAPIANFAFTLDPICGNVATFQDFSARIPQFYAWDFGDGTIDSTTNPTHTYTAPGLYTVRLIVSNNIGSDTLTRFLQVVFPTGPTNILGTDACVGEDATLQIQGNNTHTWYDLAGTPLSTGPSFTVNNVQRDTTFLVDQTPPDQILFAGPASSAIGTGSYHNSAFLALLQFEADRNFIIDSCWIDAPTLDQRTVFLWDNYTGAGAPIDTFTFTPATTGPQRIAVGIEVPAAGQYAFGGQFVNLYRNNAGAVFPYNLPGVLSIIGTSANTASDFYYYFYDWRVSVPGCVSERVPATITVADAAFSQVFDPITRTATFTDLSSNANTWSWDFGDNTGSTIQNPIHTYTSSGIYVVSLTVNGVCVFTDSIDVPSAVNLDDPAKTLAVSLTPNPAQQQVWINLNQRLDETLEVVLYSAEGKVITTDQVRAGALRAELDLSAVALGVYMVQLSGKNISQTIRLVVLNQ